MVSLSTRPWSRPSRRCRRETGRAWCSPSALSPSGNQVLAVLNGLDFPGDVMATINPSTESITATVDPRPAPTHGPARERQHAGLRVGHRRDERRGRHSEPESRRVRPGQPALRHLRRGHLARARGGQSFGPPPAETVWNDAARLLGGRGRGRDLARPSPCRPTSRRSAGSAAAAGCPVRLGGDCREVPDVSADADPSTGYIVYDTVERVRRLERSGRDERRHAAVGRRPGGRRLSRRQHRRATAR